MGRPLLCVEDGCLSLAEVKIYQLMHREYAGKMKPNYDEHFACSTALTNIAREWLHYENYEGESYLFVYIGRFFCDSYTDDDDGWFGA